MISIFFVFVVIFSYIIIIFDLNVYTIVCVTFSVTWDRFDF